MTSTATGRWLRQGAERERGAADAYDPEGEVDLDGFAGSLAAYAGLGAVLVAAGTAAGRELPNGYSLTDLALGGIATQKFARLLARSSVASPLRAPFTKFEDAAGSGEHQESARGAHGARHTVGALLTCPFCLGVWVSSCYVAGLTLAPRTARTWAAVFAVSAVADTLQHAYSRLRGD